MPEFCHLHCHTQYSLLDGAAQISNLVEKAASLEIPSLAITDHGNLFGVPEFYHKAKAAGVHPIIGCEFYIAPVPMSDRQNRIRYHQVLLAKNETGYKNLIKLSSLSYTQGYYYKPRIDLKTLKQYSEGLIATTCCLQGHVLQTILKEGEEAGLEVFKQYLDIFGEDYYIEFQDHGIADQLICNAILAKWAKQFQVKTIATNDVHYVNQTDAQAQDVMLCLQTGKDLNDPNRMRFENDQFFLKSKQDMQSVFKDLTEKLRDEALDNTREVADKCIFELPDAKLLMPHFPIPANFNQDPQAYLRHIVYERAKVRYPEMPQKVTERLEYELGIIKDMAYAGYFLVVQDFTTVARELGVRVGPGRGSAAGSCVAYCLGITNIDPLEYDLLFERFLNPERVSMPDIDIDFDDRGRAKVIDYVVKKYGRENVCQIITFGTMGARSVIRDVARVLNIPLSEADRIAKLIPEGPKENLASAKNKIPEFANLYESEDAQIRNLMEFSTVLEGSARHTGVHAAGVIIAPSDVSDYIPVSIAKGKNDDAVITQYDGSWVEAFGLLKMDFLGLKTLTILNDAIALINERHQINLDIDAIPLDDPETYKLFQKGDTVAIFQFESTGMREWMRKLKPDNLNDLIAMNALYRPGPMENIPHYIERKHGLKFDYPHPMLEEILKPTFGIPVYQEQVMQIAQVMGGYTLGGADLLRRAMGKKKQSEMDKQRDLFVEGATKNGVDKKTALEVFDLMDKFAGYGFNKSHAAAYSLVAYQTAYLKAHYPAEFMASVMTSEMSDIKKLQVNLEEVRHLGIDVLPPNINRSDINFSVVNDKIQFGLAAIKGAGSAAIESILATREKDGPFLNIFDLCKRIDYRFVNKKTLECLAKAGAMDDFEGHRAQLVESLETAIRFGQKVQSDKAAGQNSLFGDETNGSSHIEPTLPYIESWGRAQSLRDERDLMGFYVSGHPLDDYKPLIKAFATASLGNPDNFELTKHNGQERNTEYKFFGIITDFNKRITKNGRPMGFATFEDFDGVGEIVVFSSQYDQFQAYLKPDELIMARGTVEVRGGGIKIKAREILPLYQVQDKYVRTIRLQLDLENTIEQKLDELRNICDENRGNCKLYFDLFSEKLPNPIKLRSRNYVIDPSPELMKQIGALFGQNNIVLEVET